VACGFVPDAKRSYRPWLLSRPCGRNADGNEHRSCAVQYHLALKEAERLGFFQQLPNPPASPFAKGGREQSCVVSNNGVEVWFESALILTAPPAMRVIVRSWRRDVRGVRMCRHDTGEGRGKQGESRGQGSGIRGQGAAACAEAAARQGGREWDADERR
jgi:hypothetical protein